MVVLWGSFDERGNKVRQGSEISSRMSVRILVRSGVKSGTTRHPACSASPAVKRALIEFWSVFSSRMIRGKAQAYFISPFVKCPLLPPSGSDHTFDRDRLREIAMVAA